MSIKTIVGHDCPTCRANYEKSDWRDKVFAPDPFTKEKDRKCRVCGCTQYNACEGGCYWVEADLCNCCAEKENA